MIAVLMVLAALVADYADRALDIGYGVDRETDDILSWSWGLE